MRGAAGGGQRAAVAAAAAACVRVAAEVLQGIAEPSDVQVETKERMKAIEPVIQKHVQAGGRGVRASIPGSGRKLRNQASHHRFGAGPGAWREAFPPTEQDNADKCKEVLGSDSQEKIEDTQVFEEKEVAAIMRPPITKHVERFAHGPKVEADVSSTHLVEKDLLVPKKAEEKVEVPMLAHVEKDTDVQKAEHSDPSADKVCDDLVMNVAGLGNSEEVPKFLLGLPLRAQEIAMEAMKDAEARHRARIGDGWSGRGARRPGRGPVLGSSGRSVSSSTAAG
ncbi:unnamed protein product [Prorocentrum cordatum]|uniref:Uncharacterized protein n=1 Tax=Prorocentrum cordatum TaxID=2364126 RepID=A0ABN9S4G6_9DINO|nr:unnamed protein product [Polarella glacialis]